MTAKGFVFLLLEDEFGLANVVVKPHLYGRARSLVRAEPFVRVRGELQRKEGITNLLAERIEPLALPRRAPSPVAHNFG